MKILHVYKDFDPPVHGGMERHLALMCRFQREWADVQALVCSRSPHTRIREHDGVTITEVGEWGRFQRAPVAPAFPRWLKRCAGDVNVFHVPNPTAELSFLLARPRGVLVARYQSDVVRQAGAMKFYRPFLMQFLEKAAIILPTSTAYVASSPVLSAVRDRCRVVPLGILPEDFSSPDPGKVAALKSRYGSSFVLFAGMHRYYKGLQFLIQAAPRIHAPVVIAGDGPERANLVRLAENTPAIIHFPGALNHEDLVAHLHACSVFAFPSCERSEAFGISMLEAHACGKPVVATRLGTGVEFVNEDGVTGCNVPPKDAEALAAAINRLLDDPQLRQSMGENARERVTRHFHARDVARREFDLYQEALECSNTNS